MRFSRMPFSPAGRIDVVSYLRIEVDHCGIGPPRPAKIHALRYVWVGSQCALVEDKARIFFRITLPLRSNKTFLMRCAVNLAAIENSFPVSEDEVNVPCDQAVREILPGRNAGLAVGSAVAAPDIDSVLVAKQAHVMEDLSLIHIS